MKYVVYPFIIGIAFIQCVSNYDRIYSIMLAMNINLMGERQERMKESAFFDYLKSFSLNTMDTLKKL